MVFFRIDLFPADLSEREGRLSEKNKKRTKRTRAAAVVLHPSPPLPAAAFGRGTDGRPLQPDPLVGMVASM